MESKTIYFLFTDTGTYLAKAINYCTKRTLNHVSIGIDQNLEEVYSFGRKRPRNPFIGGFVREDIQSEFLKNAHCAIYRYTITVDEWESVMQHIKEIEAHKEMYKYNFIGLIGVLLQIKIDRKSALFCSQFVATVVQDIERLQFEKPPWFITPADIRSHEGMDLVFEGKLSDYEKVQFADRQLVKGEQTVPKQSFIYYLSSKVKRFVIR